MSPKLTVECHPLGTDHLIFSGGAGIFLKKIVCFPKGAKKNVFNEVKNKKFVLHSVNFFAKPFSLEAIKAKGLQITQNLTCIKHFWQAVY